MSTAARMKGFGSGIVGFAILIGMTAIGIALLEGAAAFSVWVLKWTFPAFSITLLIALLVLTPLALIPRTRMVSAVGFMIASLAFGAILWIWGMAYTYLAWGLFAVVVGLMMFGIGVVPIAIFAALVHADWANLGLFLASAVLTFGLRALARWLEDKANRRAARLMDRKFESVYEVF